MTTKCCNEVEETAKFLNLDDDENDIVLQISPLLSFASGPLVDARGDQIAASLTKLAQSGNLKQASPVRRDSDSAVKWVKKNELSLLSGKAECVSNRIKASTKSPESSPTSVRNPKMALIRSLSSSSPCKTELSAKPTRRFSDPTVPCRKSIKAFEKQASLKKLRPYLMQKLSKVGSNANSKNNAQDGGQNKEAKAGNAARLAKRLYPLLSKAYEHLAEEAAQRGTVPSGVLRTGDGNQGVNGCASTTSSFLNQIQDLEVNLANFNANDRSGDDIQPNSTDSSKIRQRQREADNKERAQLNYFKEKDVQLQVMLEDVLRSHLLALSDYSPTSCDRASRSVCHIISTLLAASEKRSDEGQKKVACQVFIGAIKENGINMAIQALWSPNDDSFAAASFRNDSVYGVAVVITSPT